MRRRIGITLGDPTGIGPEVVLKALRSGQLDRRFDYEVVGNPRTKRRADAADWADLIDAHSGQTHAQTIAKQPARHLPHHRQRKRRGDATAALAVRFFAISKWAGQFQRHCREESDAQ